MMKMARENEREYHVQMKEKTGTLPAKEVFSPDHGILEGDDEKETHSPNFPIIRRWIIPAENG